MSPPLFRDPRDSNQPTNNFFFFFSQFSNENSVFSVLSSVMQYLVTDVQLSHLWSVSSNAVHTGHRFLQWPKAAAGRAMVCLPHPSQGVQQTGSPKTLLSYTMRASNRCSCFCRALLMNLVCMHANQPKCAYLKLGMLHGARLLPPHTETHTAQQQPAVGHAWLSSFLLTPLVQLKQHWLKCGCSDAAIKIQEGKLDLTEHDPSYLHNCSHWYFYQHQSPCENGNYIPSWKSCTGTDTVGREDPCATQWEQFVSCKVSFWFRGARNIKDNICFSFKNSLF